jgi:hypothetical protein
MTGKGRAQDAGCAKAYGLNTRRGPELAARDFADGQQHTGIEGAGVIGGNGASRPRRMIGLPMRSRCAWSSRDVDARQCGERLARRYQERVEGGQPFGVVLDFLESNQIGERHHRLFANGATMVRRSAEIWPKQPSWRPKSRASART